MLVETEAILVASALKSVVPELVPGLLLEFISWDEAGDISGLRLVLIFFGLVRMTTKDVCERFTSCKLMLS